MNFLDKCITKFLKAVAEAPPHLHVQTVENAGHMGGEAGTQAVFEALLQAAETGDNQ